MINIDFINGITENITIVLANRNLDKQGKILNVSDFVYSGKLNEADEISFNVYKFWDNTEEKLWDEIYDLKLVWIPEAKQYFQIKITKSESDYNIKKITGTSLCESELSQTIIRGIEINTKNDIDRDDYTVTKFYNPDNKNGSLLHRILSIAPHYTIKYVDKSLWDIQRSFSIDNKSIYDFFIGECSEQIGCIFQFDSVDRSISVYDLYTVCNDCGYRGEYLDICPECGSTNLYSYGEDTTIFVDSENLTDEITFETNTESIKNCFKIKSGDEIMDAAVIACNPNGSDYIYYFSEQQIKDMPESLKQKLNEYDNLVKSYENEYQSLSQDLYDCIDKILYYQSSMMPNIEIPETNATTEAAKLTSENLSPLGLSTITTSTSTTTVNSAIKNYAKVFVMTGFVKVEVASGSFRYTGIDSSGLGYGEWTGNFRVTNYSNEEDIAYSDVITISVTSDYETFLHQKILKNISENDDLYNSLFDVLQIDDLNSFKSALTLYSYNRLESFADAIQGVLDVLVSENQGQSDSEYYNQLYVSYFDKLKACQDEMNVRSATISEYEHRQKTIEKRQSEIREILNLQRFLGEDLYKLFCAYRREDTYTNENFISDGLNNSEILKKANELIHLAKQEIIKSGEYQHTILSNLYNLLTIDKFKPLRKSFELGNWIRCKIDDEIYKLRLIAYEVNGNGLSNINTEFSDVTKKWNGINDVRDIINKSQQMASSYQYISKQAEQSEKTNDKIANIEKDGLNSALINIKNSDNQEFVIDKHGAICREYDDILDKYSDEQLKIVNNQIVMTDDNWKTASLAIGKHKYIYYDKITGQFKNNIGYGVSAKFLNAPYIYGGQIISGELYSDNYSFGRQQGSYMNLHDGTFSFGGGKLVWDGNVLSLKSKETTGIMSSGDTYDYNNEYGEINYYDYGDPPTDELILYHLPAGESYLDLSTGKLYQLCRPNPNDIAYWVYLKTLQKKYDVLSQNKVSKGDVSAQISIESDEVALIGNRFTVESSNFKISGSGTAEITGSFKTKNTTSGRTAKLASGGIGLFDADDTVNARIAIMGSTDTTNALGVATYRKAIVFGNGTSTGMNIAYELNYGYNFDGYTERHYFKGDARFNSTVNVYEIKFTNKEAKLYGSTWGENKCVACDGDLYVFGNIGCSGTKNRIVETEHFGKIAMNAMESASAYFTDIGSGYINGDKCYIYFDEKFAETIDQNEMYQVMITRTSEAETTWVDKHTGYFVVHGENGATFDWMIIAKQKDYQKERMETVDIQNNENITYDDTIFDEDLSPATQSEAYANEINQQDQSIEESMVCYVIDKNNEQEKLFEEE